MPRARKQCDKWMPDRVYRHPRGYVMIPRGTKKTVVVAKHGASRAEVIQLAKKVRAELDRFTVSKLFDLYFSSLQFSDLAPRTKADRLAESKNIKAAFGSFDPDSVKAQSVRRYMDQRGAKSRVQANHELACLSVVYSWGYERGLVAENPCRGIKRFKNRPRDRYITDLEYQAITDCAPRFLVAAMEISYLCAARVGDVLAMRLDQITDDGVYIKQKKTGKKQIKAWSPRLREAVSASSGMLVAGAGSTFVVCHQNGEQVTYRQLNAAWRLATSGAGISGCTFHDIKAKGISDYDGTASEKQAFSGHRTLAQVEVYDRKVRVTPSLNK